MADQVSSSSTANNPIADKWKSVDIKKLYSYLDSKIPSKRSQQSIIREAYRFSWYITKYKHKSSFLLATVEDIIGYKKWMYATYDQRDIDDCGLPVNLFTRSGGINLSWRPFKLYRTDEGDSYQPKQLAGESVATSLRYLSGFFAWLSDSQIIEQNPFRLIRLTVDTDAATILDKSRPQHRKALSLPTLRYIGQYLNSDGYHGSEKQRASDIWLVTLLYNTAHRVSAVLSLKDDNIIDHGYLKELRTIGKGKKVLSQEWTPYLEKQLMIYRETIGFKDTLQPNGYYLFQGVSGAREVDRPINPSSVEHQVKRIGRDTLNYVLESFESKLSFQEIEKLQDISPHTFRHSFATHAVNDYKVDIHRVKDILGHASYKTTEQYVQMDAINSRELRIAKDQMAKVFE